MEYRTCVKRLVDSITNNKTTILKQNPLHCSEDLNTRCNVKCIIPYTRINLLCRGLVRVKEKKSQFQESILSINLPVYESHSVTGKKTIHAQCTMQTGIDFSIFRLEQRFGCI